MKCSRSRVGHRLGKGGRYLLLRGWLADGKVQLLSMPVAGGAPKPTGLEMGIYFAVHPDGRRVAYWDTADPQIEVLAIKNLFAGQKGGR